MRTTDSAILYLDCSAGLSGDMAAGAMIDLLNDDDERILSALSFLKRHGYTAEITHGQKQGNPVCWFSVHSEQPETGHHGHHHRTLREVRQLIDEASLTPRACQLAYHVYDIIADAEAKAHGVPSDAVQFHEVASLSSIADVIAFAVCYDRLNISETVIPSLYEGTGTIQCDHGTIPVPVPAVRNILEQNSLPLVITDAAGEILTPTGAAIAAAVRTGDAIPHGYEAVKTGRGAGTRDTGLRGYAEAVLMKNTGEQSDE